MSERLFDDFGKPAGQDDIARTDDVLSELFVATNATRAFLENDPEIHAVYGPKGCGKSLLLFKKAVSLRQNPGVLVAPDGSYAYAPSSALGDADNWAPYWTLLDAEGKTRQASWAGLWTWALESTVLRLWREIAERDPVAWRQRGEHEPKLRGFLREPALPSGPSESPYDIISRQLHEMDHASRRPRGKAILPDAGPLKRLIEKYANLFPPTYLFLDNQDDLYEDNPDFWIASGVGCFRALREVHAVSQNRIHVFLSLRSEVVEQLRKSAHFPMWSGDLYEIQWQDADLLRVLEARARRLKQQHLRAPELLPGSGLSAFFGREFLKRNGDGPSIRLPSTEASRSPAHLPLGEYLLRHTLRRPRDLIVLGNAILNARSAQGEAGDPCELVREAVDRAAAQTIAMGYLAEVRERWPWHGHARGSIEDFIKRIPKNIVRPREADTLRAAFARELSLPLQDVNPFLELARLGLVGWPVQDHSRSRAEVQMFIRPGNCASQVPAAVRYFLLHPVLYGPPFHVKVVRGALIGPNLPFRYRPSTRFRSCFLSYGSPDEDLALELHSRLTDSGVDCWCHPCNATPGNSVWEEIATEIKAADRMLCLCSAASMSQAGFLDEVQRRQQDCGRDGIVVLSLDDVWRRDSADRSEQARKVRQLLESSNPVSVRPATLDTAVGQLLTLLDKVQPAGKRSARSRNTDSAGRRPGQRGATGR